MGKGDSQLEKKLCGQRYKIRGLGPVLLVLSLVLKGVKELADAVKEFLRVLRAKEFYGYLITLFFNSYF